LARPDVICLTNGVFAENCYIVADRSAGRAVLVDPGEAVDLFLARLRTENLQLSAIWLTHAHLDHVLGVAEVKQRTGVPVWLHPDDRPLYDHTPAQARALLGVELDPPPAPDRLIVPGDPLTVGTCAFEVRHVPGHSPGSVALVGEGVALVGDVLFAGSVGRTDLPGGDTATLLDSIRTQLLTLPDDTVVYPGHGPETTIGRERATNPFLTGAVRLV
jgi:glyoxylase-like metal-dependent hydrolase (beta-lactamase superfamily II)